MANEAAIINNPDNTPGLVSTGYQLQNTGFIAQRNGVDNTVINVNGTSQVDVEISGPVDVNGVLYSITTQATLTLSVTGRYCVYLNGSGDYLTPTLVLLSSTAFDDSKNARYYSGYRVLNWIIDFNSVTPETKVYRLVNANQNGIYANKMVIDDDLVVEDDLTARGNADVDGNLNVDGNLTVDVDVTIGDDLNVTDDAIIGDDLTVNGNILGDNTITGDLTLSADKDLKISGSGRVEHGGTPLGSYLSDGTPLILRRQAFTSVNSIEINSISNYVAFISIEFSDTGGYTVQPTRRSTYVPSWESDLYFYDLSDTLRSCTGYLYYWASA